MDPSENSFDANPHQPHDKLVKQVLSDPQQVKALLQAYLPTSLLAIVDLSCLQLQPNHYIDHRQHAYAVDVLYKTKITNEDAYIWLLIEHQSSDDPWLPVRTIKYIATIWDDIRKKWPKNKAIKIPFIYPLVIYNGTTPYRSTLCLKNMISPDAAQVFFTDIFIKPLAIIDLAIIPDATIREKTQNSVTMYAFLMILKHIFNADLPKILQDPLMRYFREMERLGDREHLISMLVYAYQLSEYLNEQQFFTLLERELSPNIQGEIMSIAQKMVDQGRADGMQQGMQQGKLKGQRETQLAIAKQLLAKGQTTGFVAEITGLAIAEIVALNKDTQH